MSKARAWSKPFGNECRPLPSDTEDIRLQKLWSLQSGCWEKHQLLPEFKPGGRCWDGCLEARDSQLGQLSTTFTCWLNIHWARGHMVFSVVPAITLCMRVRDVVSIRWGWLSHPGWVVFFDTKVNKQLVAVPISEYFDTWRQYL